MDDKVAIIDKKITILIILILVLISALITIFLVYHRDSYCKKKYGDNWRLSNRADALCVDDSGHEVLK